MKILLLGEFSALHKNLKEGLVELGYEVDIAASGDYWKNIDRDIDLGINGNYLIKSFKMIKARKKILELVKEYDIVQLINPFAFYTVLFPNKNFFKKLLENSKKLFVLAAGDDSFLWIYGRNKLKYGHFDDFLKYDYKYSKKYYMESKRALDINTFVADNCDGIIPIMYEYRVGYENHPKLMDTIPIPMNIDKIKYIENNVGEKVYIFHGLNKYGFKGTKYIEEAFRILSKKYPNELELVIDGHMPLGRYLEVMNKTNIVIDQTNSHSLGVNGVYALAMGKVVLGGAEPESLKAFGIEKSPVINVKPNAKNIVSEIEKLIKNKDKIKEIGKESRKFAETFHGHIIIAEQYLKAWGIKNKV